MRRLLAALVLLGAALFAAPAAAQRPVDLALVLAVDNSASITGGALDFQLRGHAEAFRNPAVAEAITGGANGAIAVTLVIWSEPNSLQVLVPWTVVGNAEDAYGFAHAIDTAQRGERTGSGSTAIGSAIDRAMPLFAGSGVVPQRKVIDLVSNGFNNAGPDPGLIRDRAVAMGITINALAILDEYPWLEEYFTENVIGGPNSFVKTAENRESFADAILQKMMMEIAARSDRRAVRFAASAVAP